MNEVICTRLDAAYRICRNHVSDSTYLKMLEALEADLKDDAYVYVPADESEVKAVKDGGMFVWKAAEGSQGKCLLAFTNREQAERHSASGTVTVKLRECVMLVLRSSVLVGFGINVLDGENGFMIEKKNLAVAYGKATGDVIPLLAKPLIATAAFRLFDVAVGVPVAVYDVDSELEKAGGAERIMKAANARWKIHAIAQNFPSKEEGLKSVLRCTMSEAFVVGSLIRKGVRIAKKANADECLARVPDLWNDIRQNTDEYMVLLADLIRSTYRGITEERLQLCWEQNATIIALGALHFAFGWGLAKCCESEGPAALKKLTARRDAFLKEMKSASPEK